MNASCDPSDIQTKNKNKIWKIVLIIVLAACALPVLIPIALLLGAGGLGILAAVGAGIAGLVIAAGSCVLGLAVAGGACAAGAVICMAAMFLGGAAAIGVGITVMFRTPASGLAIFGEGLIFLSGAVLCGLAAAYLVVLLKKAVIRMKAGAAVRKERKAAKKAASCEKRETAAAGAASAGERPDAGAECCGTEESEGAYYEK